MNPSEELNHTTIAALPAIGELSDRSPVRVVRAIDDPRNNTKSRLVSFV